MPVPINPAKIENAGTVFKTSKTPETNGKNSVSAGAENAEERNPRIKEMIEYSAST